MRMVRVVRQTELDDVVRIGCSFRKELDQLKSQLVSSSLSWGMKVLW